MSNQQKVQVITEKAPAAIGPYSQGIVFNNLVFTSGQIALNPVSGNIVGEDVAAQTAQVLENLQEVLLAAGASLNTVIKTTVFLQDMGKFTEFNSVYARYFKEPFPSRSTIEAAALPKGALVEIEAVAYIPEQ
ncbi:MAG: RidA family protein [Syntrophomonadaceae bacterium]|nr:RidA family protein [Syntrophomonadaceae bacterium]